MEQSPRDWFQEYLTPNLVQYIGVRERLFAGRTRYQQVEVLDTLDFGRALILDGKTQSSEADEFVYHEALVHPAMVTHPNPESVFIAGGGEGATLREGAGAPLGEVGGDGGPGRRDCRHLPSLPAQPPPAGAFDDARLELHFADARRYLETDSRTYDVILIDLPDPQEAGPAGALYTRNFYDLLRRRLNPGGVVAVQSEQLMTGNLEAFAAIASTLRSVFPGVYPYHAMIPSFSFDWGFNVATTGPNPMAMTAEEIDRRLRERGCDSLRSYDGQAHAGMFALARHLRGRHRIGDAHHHGGRAAGGCVGRARPLAYPFPP